MEYTAEDVIRYVGEEDVKFIRLAFCDVYGKQKNVSVMPGELERAFDGGISFDASAVRGFGFGSRSDLFLRPDPKTLAVLPWRPDHGRVVRMFCDIERPDGTVFPCDTRNILKLAQADAAKAGLSFCFGSEFEFYLFKTDENGLPTQVPHDDAGYMDIAPEDKGENVRREICLTLERMGIVPEASHHEEGPGQNEIDFHYSSPLEAADNAVTFKAVVRTIAARNGLYADFSARPLRDMPGNGLHINVSASRGGEDVTESCMAGVLGRIREMTAFLNPAEASYWRLGHFKAPGTIAWSRENRSHLIRIPAAKGCYRRFELRSPDPSANPYLAFALIMRAGEEGAAGKYPLPHEAADGGVYESLPPSLAEARSIMKSSGFIRSCLPEELINAY